MQTAALLLLTPVVLALVVACASPGTYPASPSPIVYDLDRVPPGATPGHGLAKSDTGLQLIATSEVIRSPAPALETDAVPTTLPAGQPIIWVNLAPGQSVETVLASHRDVDIWEAGRRHAIVRTNGDTVVALGREGISLVVLYVSGPDYLTSVANREDPLRIAQVNCQSPAACAALRTALGSDAVLEQGEQGLVVRLRGRQLASLAEDRTSEGYSVRLLYATEREYLSAVANKGVGQ